ncbi:aldehyde dehydrogenase (NAD+) [Tistlia consotensis]|uniref:Aldehyde dehydrogenase (NAD+) n=1 Tax=Tistlia consotensis USBA 355 TaxID=560819 RepID=A0A1Y6BDV0_9PROT|nr:aldehyde dehydrogenase family protein [Tistlia consotensis]SME98413.1 aldehyde dehydrogenase (NAD+) [Tistlia consotensis USBA 355]SNR57789.1 aldehyde dehydrogenase (NAD+) [Tistlia consotensis]
MTDLPSILPNLIGGEERPAESGRSFANVNPHDGSEICQVARSEAADVSAAVAAARAAQPGWAATPAVQRGHILHQVMNALEARADEIAAAVAAEAGKRLKDSKGEVGGAILCGRFFAGEGQRLFGRTMPSGTPNKYNMTVRTPCGVAGLIIAANTPAPNFAWKVFPALICGNAVVLKSAEDTPVSAWLMARICEEAGLPKGVLNVVHGLGAEAGQPLVDHPGVDVLSFTGSTAVGRRIAESCGRQLKKLSLELGGKNPFVVCDDADLDNAVKWACLSAYSNAGQRCAAGSRFLVFESVYEAFRDKLVEATRAQKLGVEEDCDLGPVINERQLNNMLGAIERATGKGAKVLIGGRRAGDKGCYLEPTVVEGAAPDDEISQTELFGPVASLYRVRDFAQALAMANDHPYGLTACIHTRSLDRALAFSHGVQAGATVVNAGTYGSEPHMPFGGPKQSGNGTREPGTEALDVYSELKDIYLNVDPAKL